uniref:Uncharacterized protein n=1 Tax=Arundo donax TaxID=35708 RepID=A0A0A9CUS3_ARUDO
MLDDYILSLIMTAPFCFFVQIKMILEVQSPYNIFIIMYMSQEELMHWIALEICFDVGPIVYFVIVVMWAVGLKMDGL